jgi:hypothetical protein
MATLGAIKKSKTGDHAGNPLFIHCGLHVRWCSARCAHITQLNIHRISSANPVFTNNKFPFCSRGNPGRGRLGKFFKAVLGRHGGC